MTSDFTCQILYFFMCAKWAYVVFTKNWNSEVLTRHIKWVLATFKIFKTLGQVQNMKSRFWLYIPFYFAPDRIFFRSTNCFFWSSIHERAFTPIKIKFLLGMFESKSIVGESILYFTDATILQVLIHRRIDTDLSIQSIHYLKTIKTFYFIFGKKGPC